VEQLIVQGAIRKEDIQGDAADLEQLAEVEKALSILLKFPGTYLPISLLTPSTVRIFDLGFKAGTTKKCKILVERFLGLGDVLLALIVCRGLFLKYGFKIYFVTSELFFTLAERMPFIEQVMTGEEAETFRFDLKIRLQGEVDFLPLCEKNHRLDLMAAIAGLEREYLNTDFRLPLKESEREQSKDILMEGKWNPEEYLIGVNIQSFADLRTWPIVRTENLVKRLAQSPQTRVVILENQEVRSRFANIPNVILPKCTDLESLIGLVSFCDLVVCPDSGILHLAGALKRPTVALFGPILPDFRTRYYSRCEVLYHPEVFCSPCWDLQTYNCVNGDYKACLLAITVDEVFDKIDFMRKKYEETRDF